MKDQAARLREFVSEQKATQTNGEQTMTARVIAVASGKGGVGKSNFATNLGIEMSRLGKKVVIIDADFGLANVEILMGVVPKYSVSDVLGGRVSMEAALTAGPMGCSFLSGGTGITALSELSDAQLERLTDGFYRLDKEADCIIIDTRAGLSNAVINFIQAASETVIITTPDPTAIADAYALIKSVKKSMPEMRSLKLVINCAMTKDEAEDVHFKLSAVSKRFLGIELAMLGFIPHDPYLVKAVRKQKPVSLLFPLSKCATSIREICADLLKMDSSEKSSIRNFVLKLIGRIRT